MEDDEQEPMAEPVAMRVEPREWDVIDHKGRVLGMVETSGERYYAWCYDLDKKRRSKKPVNLWSASYDTLDEATDEIIADHYPKAYKVEG